MGYAVKLQKKGGDFKSIFIIDTASTGGGDAAIRFSKISKDGYATQLVYFNQITTNPKVIYEYGQVSYSSYKWHFLTYIILKSMVSGTTYPENHQFNWGYTTTFKDVFVQA